MDYKYYNKLVRTVRHVSWQCLDAKNKVIDQETNEQCFSDITYDFIPKEVKKLVVFHNRKLIPYSDEKIRKWIENLNELGFPATLKFSKLEGKVYFILKLENYKYKLHINSMLQLIRCLYEQYICFVPEHFFGYLDKNPNATVEEKFVFLQRAHADTTLDGHNCYANTNHMITHNGNFETPLTKKEFFQRLIKTGKGVYENKSGGRYDENLTKLWRTKN